MRRVSGLVLVFGLFAGALVSGPSAQADFHPVCAGVVTGGATVDFDRTRTSPTASSA